MGKLRSLSLFSNSKLIKMLSRRIRLLGFAMHKIDGGEKE